MQTMLWVAGVRGDRPDGSRAVYFNAVGPNYFETLGLPVVRGRGITDADRDGAPGAVVVNETMARRLWPDGDALGRRVSLDGPTGPWLTVVGVARDAKYNSLGEDTPPFMYLSAEQGMRAQMVLQVRAADPAAAASLGRALRAAVMTLDPLLPPPPATTVEQDMRVSMLPAQAGAAFTAAFGGLALLLATVGVYGLRAFDVSRRTREIGIRMALGATTANVERLILREGMRTALVGVAVGLLLALGVGKLVSGLLYRVSPFDPAVLAVAVVVLAVSALAASYVPARRASRVMPTEALRAE
jgi:predicted permease